MTRTLTQTLKRIPIFTDEPFDLGGWHGSKLSAAFAKRGFEAVFISLKDCCFDFSPQHSSSQSSIQLQSFFNALPQAAFIRGIAGGTLQQVILRLDFLHALQLSGVKVYNSAKAIERTVDKAMTSFLLHQQGIFSPKTWVCESRAQAQAIIEREIEHNQKLVIKPLFGSQGKGVRILDASTQFPVPMQEHVDGVYYMQQFIESSQNCQWHDTRVFIISNKAVAAMKRFGKTWVNNVANGGRCEAITPTGEVAELAIQAAKILDIDYCGVDIITDAQGLHYVLEVNSIPAWQGLQSVVELDIAQAMVDDLLEKCI